MSEIRLDKPISWLDGIDPRTGRIVQEDHPQRGQSIAGKVVYVPHSIGSTVGAYTFFALRMYGTAPKKIVLEKPDSITISAELAGIPVQIPGGGEMRFEEDVEVIEEFRRYLEKEASITGAEGFVKVSSVHISGVSYATIGEAGRRWLESLKGRVKFRALASTNPLGMDLMNWREYGIPENFAEGQMSITESLIEMGAIPTFTCTPFLSGNLPRCCEHVAWGESSAVAFANSVIGAKTNREGGTKTIVAAATGYTPKYGLHHDEKRLPDLEVTLRDRPRGLTDLYALAYLIGQENPRSSPIYRNLGHVSLPEFKALSAAGAASGSIEIFHIPGVTPNKIREVGKRVEVSSKDLDAVREDLSTFDGGADLVVIGCPHLSLQEFQMLADMLDGRRVKVDFWVYASRAMISVVERSGVAERLRRAGVRFWADTCMVVSPLEKMGVRKVATNSAKAAKYLRTLRGLEVELLDLMEIVERYTSSSST